MLTQALGITTRHDRISLTGGEIWIAEDREATVDPEEIVASPRVGVDYAGPDAARRWRFRIRNCPWTSLPK